MLFSRFRHWPVCPLLPNKAVRRLQCSSQPAELRSMAKQAEFVGRAEALEKVDLRARVQGFLGSRLFKDGDAVKEGQVVFTIEKEPFEAAVDQRKAQLAAAQATLANADQQLARTAELTRKGNAPVAQLDQRTAEQGQAKAAVMEAEANLRDAQIQLSYTDIKSPISGRIGRPAVSPGNLVGPDTGVLATVVKEDPMQVLFLGNAARDAGSPRLRRDREGAGPCQTGQRFAL